MKKILAGAICLGVFALAWVLSQLGVGVQGGSALSAPSEASTSALVDPLPSKPGAAARASIGSEIDALDSPCEYFDRWRELACSPRNLAAFLDEEPELGQLDLACIPSEWLVLALVMNCSGERALSISDADLIATEVAPRLPDPIALSKTALLEQISPSALSCFISTILPSGASGETVGKAWAWGLVAAFGEKGNMFEADPEVLAALRLLMAEWPIEDDQWWSHLWAGLPGDPHLESLNVRVAIFEALHETLPVEEWVNRLAVLSELERYDSIGSQSLWCIGDTLRKNLLTEDYFSLITLQEGAEWRRALLFGFPHEMQWPNIGSTLVPDFAREQIIALRDSDEYPFRTEILKRQWELLGPEMAVSDLETFVFDSVRNSDDWEYNAGLRVGAAIDAALVSSSPHDGDAALLDHAKFLVRDFLIMSSIEETRRILGALRDRNLLPSDAKAANAWKKKLVQVLGPEGMMSIDVEFRVWLEAG